MASWSLDKECTMKTYNVHLYREMRLSFPGIVASTAAEAARLAAEMPAEAAEALEDCDGTNFAALIRVAENEADQPRWIDFDAVKAMAPDLVTALEAALPVLQEALYAPLCSHDPTVRLALARVESVIAIARGKTA